MSRAPALSRTLACAIVVALAGLAVMVPTAGAAQQSQNVVFVPSSSGDSAYGGGNGGDMPTTGFPNGYAPSFRTATAEGVRDDSMDPLAGADTAVLVQICTINDFLSNPQFRGRIENFVQNGGKLIVWDSECSNPGPDYSNFVFPFKTDNPGANGASGQISDLEENGLSSSDPASPRFVDIAKLGSDTEVGDANVFTSFDEHWCADLRATNTNNVTGPVSTYAPFGSGVIIYTGLDMDSMGSTFDPQGSGSDQEARLWLNQLLLKGGDPLACKVKVSGLSLSPKDATNPVGITHTVTATLTDASNPKPGVTVTFTVTAGPNQGRTGTATTDANGVATFTYQSNGKAGTDTIQASAPLARADGSSTTVTDTASKKWVDNVNQLGLPPTRKCVDTRKFKFTLHHARTAKVVDVTVYINGKRKLHKAGKDIKTLTIKKLPKKRFKVQIIAVQNTGSSLISVRTYKGCKKSKPHTRRGGRH